MIFSLKDNYYYEADSNVDKTLYSLNRIGYGPVPDLFEVTRTGEYQYCTVHYVYDGCGMLCINDKDYLLNKGDVFVVSAGVPHKYYCIPSTNFSVLWIEFCGSNFNQLISPFKRNNYVVKNNTYEIASSIYSIHEKTCNHDILSKYDISSEIYKLIMILLKSIGGKDEKDAPEIILKSLKILDNNYTDKIDIQKLASDLFVSHSHFVKQFKKYIGTTPNKYLILKRIEHACYLLKSTSLSSDEISHIVGMYDNAYFYKCFKIITNTSPNKYRNQ